MSENQLPAKLESDLPLEPVVIDKQSKINLAEMGLTYIPDGQLKKLGELGVHFEGVGVMKVQGGLAISAQLLVHQAMTILSKKLNAKKVSVETAVELSKTLGYTLSKLTESQKYTAISLRAAPRGEGDEKPKPPNQAFPAGGVYINMAPGSKVEIGEKPVANPPAES